jgi:hypothetical protein
MNNKLSPQVTLPLAITRGTVKERENKAKHDVDKLYRELYPDYKKNNLNCNNLKKSINNIFPKINISILPLEFDPEFEAYSDIIYNPITEKISGTTIEIPLTKKKKIFKEEILSILHEFQHIADQIYQPKFLARNQRLHLKELFNDKYNFLYDNFMYYKECPESNADKKEILQNLKYKIQKFLKGYSAEDKLDFIQDSRYTLMQEDNAYHTQSKYANKLYNKHHPISIDELVKPNKDFMFSEKIQLLTDMGFEIIKEERGKLHAKQKNLLKLAKKSIKL